jgi:hypothetical protein
VVVTTAKKRKTLKPSSGQLVKDAEERRRMKKQKIPFKDKLDAGRTVCISCGYDGDNIQGEDADIYEGYGCPKCHSPLVVKRGG